MDKGQRERLRLSRQDFYMFALKLCGYNLRDRELKVLLFKYYCKMPLSKISQVLNGEVSRQRIFQIEKKALNKIKINLTKRKSQCIL